MEEKLRPGYEVMQQQAQTAVGVTPNPAGNLAWPMSYSSNVPPPPRASFERTAAGFTPAPASASLTTAGTRYDPIRQGQQQQQQIHPDLADDTNNDDSEKQVKRKRTEIDTIEGNPGGEETEDKVMGNYSYQPQKIVTPTNSLQSGKRSHVCDLCGATFTRQHNLKSHFLTHTSSKKEFICSECGSEFRRSHDLKRHQKLHTGEKPFACATCGRRFARADALGRHTKSTGEAGCVNSRRAGGAGSDTGSAGDAGQVMQLISPTESTGQSNSIRRGSEPGLSSDRSPIHIQNFETQNLPSVNYGDPTQPPSSSSSSQHQYPQQQQYGESGNQYTLEKDKGESRAALPPLRTAFPFDHAQSFAESSNTREILPSPPFGLPTAFEPRSSSAHPLSFDRGSVQDSAGGSNSAGSGSGQAGSLSSTQSGQGQSMVPLQRFRQLEAEHQAAMERIRHFEGDHD